MRMKFYAILFAIVLLLGGIFFLANRYFYNGKQSEGNVEQIVTHIDSTTGFSFSYRVEPDGYVLLEPPPGLDQTYVKAYVLTLKKDLEFMQTQPEASEGPPVIAINMFRNPQHLDPHAWALAHPEYSNTSLLRGEIRDVLLSGAPAVRYLSDGLYVSDTVVATHGEFAYVVFGGYLDEYSLIRRDFEPLLTSFLFGNDD